MAVVALSAVAGAFVDVEPSGSRVADRVLAAALVGLVAAAASSAKRWTWFVAAGPALALARGGVAIACGAAALLIAIVSTDPVRPNPARGAAVGGLAALALLQATGPSTTGASALLVALAVAPVLVSGYRHAARHLPDLGLLLIVHGATVARPPDARRPTPDGRGKLARVWSHHRSRRRR